MGQLLSRTQQLGEAKYTGLLGREGSTNSQFFSERRTPPFNFVGVLIESSGMATSWEPAATKRLRLDCYEEHPLPAKRNCCLATWRRQVRIRWGKGLFVISLYTLFGWIEMGIGCYGCLEALLQAIQLTHIYFRTGCRMGDIHPC